MVNAMFTRFLDASAGNPSSSLLLPVIVSFGIILLLVLFFSFVPLKLWIAALASNVRVGIFTLIGMKLRRVRPESIINPMIQATKAGIPLPISKLEAHYLAGGNVDKVVKSLVAAQ